jgi:hypothetical protein
MKRNLNPSCRGGGEGNDVGLREKRAEPGFLITPARHESCGYSRRTSGVSAPGSAGREVAALRQYIR